MSAQVLIVEDDRELLRLLQLDLERNGYLVSMAGDGAQGLSAFNANTPDLVVLDVALPGMNGLDLCRKIREISDVPVLMMTAHAVSEEEIAEGLDSGADEYMLKPFGNIEFHARVRALLRRANLQDMREKQLTGYDDGHLSVDLAARRVKIANREVRLTPTEFNLLATFIQNRGKVLTFTELLEQVWGVEYKNEHHYPRIYVSHLRRKIEPNIKNPTYIHNEYGVGYRFVARKLRP